MKILADATLPDLQMVFLKHFELSVYHNLNQLQELLPLHDVLLCRSTLPVNENLLKHNKLSCLATASSGTDHIDSELLYSKNIQLFDAKGSNAVSVADYVIASLMYLDKTYNLHPKKAVIIGMGAVGSIVFRRLQLLNMEIATYDPRRSLRDPDFKSCLWDKIFDADLICIHANLHNEQPFPSLGLLSKETFSLLKPGAIIINASRGGIVCENALLNSKNPLYYCTDVFMNEPDINPDIVSYATLCTPHIAGHSIEAKKEAVLMVSDKIHHYFGLPVSERTHQTKITFSSTNEPWQEQILNLYTPETETLALKTATIKKETFQQLRKNHQYRHNMDHLFSS